MEWPQPDLNEGELMSPSQREIMPRQAKGLFLSVHSQVPSPQNSYYAKVAHLGLQNPTPFSMSDLDLKVNSHNDPVGQAVTWI